MKWVIINEYAKKGYSIANHNGISGYFKSNKPYYGLYKYKIGFNGDIFEYIGEFNLVINKYLYFFINKFNFIEKNKK
jgi:peptidoglycan pentaglycine glycine transferase (the first glycine)